MFWWMNRGKIQCFFYDSTGNVYRKVVKPVENKFKIRFARKMHRYVVDRQCVYYDQKKKMPTLNYYVGNPVPILLKYEQNPTANSLSLHNVIKDKSIQDLFSNTDLKDMLLLILVAANLLISIVLIVKALGVLD